MVLNHGVSGGLAGEGQHDNEHQNEVLHIFNLYDMRYEIKYKFQQNFLPLKTQSQRSQKAAFTAYLEELHRNLNNLVLCKTIIFKSYLNMIGMNEWELIQYGPSFIGAELLFIKQTIASEIYGLDYEPLLQKKAQRISKILKFNIGKGEWQVVCIKGNHAHKFVCSRTFFCIFQKKDGLKIYVWINKFKTEEQSLQLPQ